MEEAMSSVALKCPADFFALGPNTLVLGQESYCHWRYPHQRDLTYSAIAACTEHLPSRVYSHQLLEQFITASVQAIAFVRRRTCHNQPLNISLLRFTRRGQRCVVLVVDGLPLPGSLPDLPNPTDPALLEPTLDRHLTHACILQAVDGYLITSDERILQLTLSWSESVQC